MVHFQQEVQTVTTLRDRLVTIATRDLLRGRSVNKIYIVTIFVLFMHILLTAAGRHRFGGPQKFVFLKDLL